MRITAKDKENIRTYNVWVKKQEEIIRGANTYCSYFEVENDCLEKLSPGEEKTWGEIENLPDHLFPNAFWREIISKNRKAFRSTLTETVTKKIQKHIKFRSVKLEERIDPANLLLTEKIHLSSDFLRLCRQKGLLVQEKHFEWYEENGLIRPLLKKSGKTYYSMYQIIWLNRLERWKERSLKSPSPTTWQEYLLQNRTYIISKEKRWRVLPLVALNVRDLYQSFLLATKKTRPPVNKKLDRNYSSITILNKFIIPIFGKRYSNKFPCLKSGDSCSLSQYWRIEIAQEARRNNPLLQLVKKTPELRKIFGSLEKYGLSQKHETGRKPLQFANYLHKIIDLLGFYLECAFDSNEPSTDEILSLGSEDTCLICYECKALFQPNPSRRSGTKQVVCDSEKCKTEYKKKKDAERYKLMKLIKKKS